MTAALITRSHINAGAFGLFGFPILSALYAYFRVSNEPHRTHQDALRQRVAQLEQELRHARGHGQSPYAQPHPQQPSQAYAGYPQRSHIEAQR